MNLVHFQKMFRRPTALLPTLRKNAKDGAPSGSCQGTRPSSGVGRGKWVQSVIRRELLRLIRIEAEYRCVQGFGSAHWIKIFPYERDLAVCRQLLALLRSVSEQM